MRPAALALAALLAALPALSARADDATDCDRLAASPLDPQRAAAGVDFDDIATDEAEAACRAAVAAAPGNPRLLYQLGRALDAADKLDEALAIYEEAFAAGYPIAARAIGAIYENRDEPDYAQAAEWYRKAIDAGFIAASADLGWLYEDGLGVEKDASTAAELYLKAAEAGDAAGQVHLGYLYENGSGVPQNAGLAVRWYRAAAEQGDAIGQFDLGIMYAEGTGVGEDDVEAVRLFRLAAAQDYAPAMLELARHARDGEGMPRDRGEAEKQFRLAIASDDDDTVWQAENELAWMWAVHGGDIDEAARLAADALERVPDGDDRPAVLDTAAWIAHLQGRDADALPLQEEAAQSESDYGPFHDRLGDILAGLGRHDEAVAAWKRALAQSDPVGDDLWDRAAVYLKVSPPADDAPTADRASSAPSVSPSR